MTTKVTALGGEALATPGAVTKITAFGGEALATPGAVTKITAFGGEALVTVSVPIVVPLPSTDVSVEEAVTVVEDQPLYTPEEAKDLGGQRVTLRWEITDYAQNLTLAGTLYKARIVYKERTRSWYLDLFTSDNRPIALGRRLTPGWGPLFGVRPEISLPEGVLVVSGPEDYDRDDLGHTLHLTLYPTGALKQIPGADDGAAVSVDIVTS